MEKFKTYFIIILVIFMIIFTYCIFDGLNAEAKPIKKNNIKDSNTIFVDIKGAVRNPGVYEIKENSRVIDAIKKAGDLTDDADTSIINLSKKLSDEMYIIIYTKDEVDSYRDKYNSSSEIVSKIEDNIICPNKDNDACLKKNSTKTSSNKSSNKIEGKININTADINELTKLNGIGESKAKKIIKYRENNKFNNIEDIKNVSGIGDSLYEKIKNNIEI